MEVGSFTLEKSEIGAESIQAVLQLDDAELGFGLLALELLKLVEGGGKLLFLCLDAFSQIGFDIASLFDNLLHADDFLAQNGILFVSQAKLFRIIGLRVAAAQRKSTRCTGA